MRKLKNGFYLPNKEVNYFNLNIHKLDNSDNDKRKVLEVFYETKKRRLINKTINKYFEDKWIGYGVFEEIFVRDEQLRAGKWIEQMFAYCFVKYSKKRPETMTQVHSAWRNRNVATLLRNYVLKQREFIGNIVYSAVELNNPASIKSVLKSGFQVFDLTKDGYIQFVKILSYKK